jgi:hypothetical protein
MTTSHEPSASRGAEGESDAITESQGQADGAISGAASSAAPAVSVPGKNESPDGAIPVAPTVALNGAGADDVEDSLDEDEYDGEDEYDDVDDSSGSGLSFLAWRPSQGVALVAGATLLAVALLLPIMLAAFGARGVGPLAAHPTPTITPTATPTPPQQVTLQDPLTKRSTRWPEQQDCSMREDGYHITANNICFLAGAPIRDGYVTVTVMQMAGVEDLSYGVTLRRASKGNYYSFEIDGSGRWYFYKAAVDSNGASVLTLLAGHTANPAIHKGKFEQNTLQVRATGQQFEFFVNDVKVGQVNDSSYAEGTIGLGGNDQLEVVYTNFILTQSA